MARPLLYDTVTLRHFSVAGRLDICEARHSGRPLPRWCQQVYGEIEAASLHGIRECTALLSIDWLGEPVAPETKDLKEIYRLQVALNDGRQPPTEHAGEAESIYFAQKLEACFATDDNGAYDFAVRRLGPGRVMDTVEILRDAVAAHELSEREAAGVAAAIQNSDRDLLHVHPLYPPARYFR